MDQFARLVFARDLCGWNAPRAALNGRRVAVAVARVVVVAVFVVVSRGAGIPELSVGHFATRDRFRCDLRRALGLAIEVSRGSPSAAASDLSGVVAVVPADAGIGRGEADVE